MRRLPTSLFIIIAVIPFLSILVPLISLVANGNGAGGLDSGTVGQAFWVSCTSATVTTGVSLGIGLPTALLLAKWRYPGKSILEAVVLLPIVLPPLVGGMAELTLFGPNAPIGASFANLGIPLTDSWFGVVVAQTFVAAPFLIMAAKVGFEEMPTELSEAAKLSGTGWWSQIFYLYIPIAKRSIITGILLTFTRAFGEFGATMMMAYHPYTVPIDLYVRFSSGGLASMVRLATWVIAFAFLVALVAAALQRSDRRK